MDKLKTSSWYKSQMKAPKWSFNDGEMKDKMEKIRWKEGPSVSLPGHLCLAQWMIMLEAEWVGQAMSGNAP